MEEIRPTEDVLMGHIDSGLQSLLYYAVKWKVSVAQWYDMCLLLPCTRNRGKTRPEEREILEQARRQSSYSCRTATQALERFPYLVQEYLQDETDFDKAEFGS